MITAILLAVNLLLLPLLVVGVIRKVKALMQTRVGAPVLQPFFDLAKLLRKGETVSETASWVFTLAPVLGLAVSALVAALVPWIGPLLPAGWSGATNLVLVVYLMALATFATMLAAMDTGSAFGGLGASREATIALLVEPALLIGLGALALGAGSADLAAIYARPMQPVAAGLVGIALLIAALAELSRMPVDDPTTHLELTMVHEAMILENSGRNLALLEYGVALRTCVLLGLSAQTLLHAWPGLAAASEPVRYALSVLALFVLAAMVAVAEGVLVKLRWRSVPAFIAFATVFSVLAAIVAVTKGAP